MSTSSLYMDCMAALLMLNAAADVNQQVAHCPYGNAFVAACHKGDTASVKLLLEARADVNLELVHGSFGNALAAATSQFDQLVT